MKVRLLLCGAVLSLLLTQCTKDPLKNMSNEESRIYITNYDTTAVFSNYKTFKLADSVAYIQNNRLQSKSLSSGDAQMVSAVSSALISRGFTPVSSGATPDLGVTVSVITNTSTQVVDYTNYGGYYGGYWDPYYWGGGYYNDPYYFPTYYGVYQTGETALSIDMIDLKNAAQNGNKLDVVWSGLIRGAGIFSGSTISDQIAALFAQSPYLKTTP